MKTAMSCLALFALAVFTPAPHRCGGSQFQGTRQAQQSLNRFGPKNPA
jgi:hypothetical protein